MTPLDTARFVCCVIYIILAAGVWLFPEQMAATLGAASVPLGKILCDLIFVFLVVARLVENWRNERRQRQAAAVAPVAPSPITSG